MKTSEIVLSLVAATFAGIAVVTWNGEAEAVERADKAQAALNAANVRNAQLTRADGEHRARIADLEKSLKELQAQHQEASKSSAKLQRDVVILEKQLATRAYDRASGFGFFCCCWCQPPSVCPQGAHRQPRGNVQGGRGALPEGPGALPGRD